MTLLQNSFRRDAGKVSCQGERVSAFALRGLRNDEVQSTCSREMSASTAISNYVSTRDDIGTDNENTKARRHSATRRAQFNCVVAISTGKLFPREVFSNNVRHTRVFSQAQIIRIISFNSY